MTYHRNAARHRIKKQSKVNHTHITDLSDSRVGLSGWHTRTSVNLQQPPCCTYLPLQHACFYIYTGQARQQDMLHGPSENEHGPSDRSKGCCGQPVNLWPTGNKTGSSRDCCWLSQPVAVYLHSTGPTAIQTCPAMTQHSNKQAMMYHNKWMVPMDVSAARCLILRGYAEQQTVPHMVMNESLL